VLDKVVAQTNGNSVLNSFPFDAEALAAQKVSAKQAAHYVKSGWLVRLGHGVSAYPSDSLDAPYCILLLERNSPGLYVGGMSALDLHGVRHTLAFRKNWILWGEQGSFYPRSLGPAPNHKTVGA
jgi:hypothetical protein